MIRFAVLLDDAAGWAQQIPLDPLRTVSKAEAFLLKRIAVFTETYVSRWCWLLSVSTGDVRQYVMSLDKHTAAQIVSAHYLPDEILY